MEIPFGKRLKSEMDRIMFERFPGSRVTKVLPAGRPSPPVDSYITDGGYYQLIDPEVEGPNLYLKDTDDLQVVDADAEDESSTLGRAGAWLSTKLGNTAREINAQAGFLESGIDDTFSGIGAGILNFGGNLKWIAILAIPAIIIILVLVLLITSKAK